LDGSADSVAALNWAIAEARLRDLTVVACHARHRPDSHDVNADTGRVRTAAGEQILDQAMAQLVTLYPGTSVRTCSP
jgi:hypothetical protein